MISPPLPILATARLPPRPIALMRQTTLAGRFSLRRVCHGMVMVPASLLVRLPAPRRNGFLRRLGRDKTVAAVADQVLPSGLDQCFPHGKPVLRFEELHQRPLHLAVAKVVGDVHLLLG